MILFSSPIRMTLAYWKIVWYVLIWPSNFLYLNPILFQSWSESEGVCIFPLEMDLIIGLHIKG